MKKNDKPIGQDSSLGRPRNFTPVQIKTLQGLVEQFAAEAVEKEAERIANERIEALMREVPDAICWHPTSEEKVYIKFSTAQLVRLFGGWFTLTYAFSVKAKGRNKNKNGEDGDTDYWICSQDVSMLKANERPPLNKPIYKKFGKEVYGFAIIAPSTAF